MRIKYMLGFTAAIAMAFVGCKSQKNKFEFKSPESGARIVYGQQVKVSLNFPSETIDSVLYSVDGVVVERRTDTAGFVLDTQKVGLGDKSISAKLYIQGKEDLAYSNVLVLPANAKNYGFEVVNTFPHDVKAFTQGLQFVDGNLYETTGRYKESTLRKVNLTNGSVEKSVSLGDDVFGEGMTVVGNKIVVLSWENKQGYFYDKSSFAKLGAFQYENSKEGWGLTYDGTHLLKSDGTNKIYFLNRDSGKEEKFISVYDENGAVDSLNELEFIDGKIYANVYQQEIIVIINPESGAVEGRINLVGMFTEGRQPYDNELNGIAYDHTNKRLFVTGKLWPKLFEIKLIER